MLAVSTGPQRQFGHYWQYRSSHGTDFDVSELASPVLAPYQSITLVRQGPPVRILEP